MHTMRERAAESNQRKIECPFCRVPFSADHEQSTPRFRYAECLADKLGIDGREKKGKKLVTESKNVPKPVLLMEIDVTDAPIIAFMEFGDGTDLYTTAGGLSLEFGNPGIYMTELGKVTGSVKHFGAMDCRYDGLAFMGGFLYAVNYTAWRLEIYATRYTLNGWPQLLNSIDFAGCHPKITQTEIQALVYRCPKGKHLLSSCDHITVHMDLDKMIAESIPRDHQYDGSNLIFASNTEKWYMDGNNLIRSFGKAKQKQLVITNWTSITPYECKKILYTVKESANIFVAQMDTGPQNEQVHSLVTSSAPRRSFNKPLQQVFVNTENVVPRKITSSDSGYTVVLGNHKDHRLLQLYACQKSVNKRTKLQSKDVITQQPPSGMLSTIVERAKNTFLLLLTAITYLILFTLINTSMLYALCVIQNYVENELGYMITVPVLDIFTKFNIPPMLSIGLLMLVFICCKFSAPVLYFE